MTDENIYKKCLWIAKQISKDKSETEYQAQAYRIQKEHLLNDPHHLEKFDAKTFERVCNDFGIFCVTPDAENILMWSYYADSHKGFCIGYDSKYLVRCGLFNMGGRIAYKDEFPVLPMFLEKDDSPLINILFTKWSKWKHEDEYRLIHLYKKGREFQADKEAIKEIVLGSQIPDQNKVRIISKLIETLPNAKIYEIKPKKETFGLEKFLVYEPGFN